MTTYHEYKVNLSEGQKAKLAKAMKDSSPITLRLSKDELVGNDELMLTKTQISTLKKAIRKRTRAEIKISKSQVKKAVKHGGSLCPPCSTSSTGALSALGSLGIDKIFGKGVSGGMVNPVAIIMKMIEKGIKVPSEFLSKLASLGDILTKGLRNLVGRGIQSGSRIVLKPRQRQIQGGFLKTLAAIGISMAIELVSKLFGKGLQVPKKAGMGLQVSPKPFFAISTPLFMERGNSKAWEEKKIWQGASVGSKQSLQQHSTAGGNPLKDVPLSNFDLLDWVRFLKIENFKGIFSGDSKDHLHRAG